DFVNGIALRAPCAERHPLYAPDAANCRATAAAVAEQDVIGFRRALLELDVGVRRPVRDGVCDSLLIGKLRVDVVYHRAIGPARSGAYHAHPERLQRASHDDVALDDAEAVDLRVLHLTADAGV